MATISSIEWTEMTWNPVTGCTKSARAASIATPNAWRSGCMRWARPDMNGFRPTLHWDLLDLPKRWKKPRVIFVNSMSDLFQTMCRRISSVRVRHDGGLPAAHVSGAHKAQRSGCGKSALPCRGLAMCGWA